jgi:uncharacterized protein (TIGR00156 family)
MARPFRCAVICSPARDDRYQFRDKSGTITAIIPVAAFNEQHVEPDDLVSINGSLDRKMTPPVVRIDRLLKQSPK